jgi:hypothetical protein
MFYYLNTAESGLKRGMASLEKDNLVVFYYLRDYCSGIEVVSWTSLCLQKDMVKPEHPPTTLLNIQKRAFTIKTNLIIP